MEEKDLQIQLQDYIAKKLSDEETVAFEKELASNQDLQNDLALLQDIEKEMTNRDLIAFKKKIGKIVEKEPVQSRKTKKVVIFPKRILALAASFLLIGLVGWWILFNDSSINEEYLALANENFIHYPAQQASRGVTSEKEIYSIYEEKAYDKAATQLEKYSLNNQDEEAQLFAGIAYLGNNQPQKAIELLKSLPDTPYFINKKQYYLGLAYLKINNKEEAVNAFMQINEGDKPLFDRAQKMLQVLQ